MAMPVALRVQSVLEKIGFRFRAAPSSSLFGEKAVSPYLQLFAIADPDEVLTKAGITRPSLRVLNSDDEITTALDTRREALLSVSWHLEDGNEEAGQGGKKTSQDGRSEPLIWVEKEFERWATRAMRGMMQALPFGYSVLECVYKTDPETARVTWREVTEKPFEWFIPKLDGTVLYRSRETPQGEEVDPRKFFLTVREQTYRNPYGEALFSRLYWPWFFRQQGWKFWCKWLERFGIPLLVGKTQGDAKAMAVALSAAVQDAAVGVGSGDEVQMLANTGGAGHFEGFERAVCARIQKLILGQTLTTDSGGSSGTSGSYALGQVHNEVREDRRNADVRMVTETAQRMIDVLWGINGFPGKPPVFIMADDTGLETERATRDATLCNAGVVKFTNDYLLRVYDYEEGDLQDQPEPMPAGTFPGQPGGADPENPTDPKAQSEGDAGNPAQGDAQKGAEPGKKQAKTKGKGSAAMGLPGTGGQSQGGVVFAPPRFTRSQMVVEDGVAQALAALKSVPAGISDQDIKAAIKAATGPADLLDKLEVLFAGTDAAEFRIVVERALFAADLLGYAHASTSK